MDWQKILIYLAPDPSHSTLPTDVIYIALEIKLFKPSECYLTLRHCSSSLDTWGPESFTLNIAEASYVGIQVEQVKYSNLNSQASLRKALEAPHSLADRVLLYFPY